MASAPSRDDPQDVRDLARLERFRGQQHVAGVVLDQQDLDRSDRPVVAHRSSSRSVAGGSVNRTTVP